MEVAELKKQADAAKAAEAEKERLNQEIAKQAAKQKADLEEKARKVEELNESLAEK